MNINVQVYVGMFSFLLGMSGIAGSYDIPMFNLLKNCQAVFQNCCTILQSQQQYIRVQISPRPRQYLLFVILIVTILVGVKWCLAFPWWLMLNIFSCAYWSVIYLFFFFLRNFFSDPLPIFRLDYLPFYY